MIGNPRSVSPISLSLSLSLCLPIHTHCAAWPQTGAPTLRLCGRPSLRRRRRRRRLDGRTRSRPLPAEQALHGHARGASGRSASRRKETGGRVFFRSHNLPVVFSGPPPARVLHSRHGRPRPPNHSPRGRILPFRRDGGPPARVRGNRGTRRRGRAGPGAGGGGAQGVCVYERDRRKGDEQGERNAEARATPTPPFLSWPPPLPPPSPAAPPTPSAWPAPPRMRPPTTRTPPWCGCARAGRGDGGARATAATPKKQPPLLPTRRDCN